MCKPKSATIVQSNPLTIALAILAILGAHTCLLDEGPNRAAGADGRTCRVTSRPWERY